MGIKLNFIFAAVLKPDDEVARLVTRQYRKGTFGQGASDLKAQTVVLKVNSNYGEVARLITRQYRKGTFGQGASDL